MAIIKCKMCGADLVLTPDSTIAECEYCGTVQTVPSADNEKKLTLLQELIALEWPVNLIKQQAFMKPL